MFEKKIDFCKCQDATNILIVETNTMKNSCKTCKHENNINVPVIDVSYCDAHMPHCKYCDAPTNDCSIVCERCSEYSEPNCKNCKKNKRSTTGPFCDHCAFHIKFSFQNCCGWCGVRFLDDNISYVESENVFVCRKHRTYCGKCNFNLVENKNDICPRCNWLSMTGQTF